MQTKNSNFIFYHGSFRTPSKLIMLGFLLVSFIIIGASVAEFISSNQPLSHKSNQELIPRLFVAVLMQFLWFPLLFRTAIELDFTNKQLRFREGFLAKKTGEWIEIAPTDYLGIVLINEKMTSGYSGAHTNVNQSKTKLFLHQQNQLHELFSSYGN